MSTFTIYEASFPLEDRFLRVVELWLEISLPKSYRDFILRHNGGYPEPSTFPIREHPTAIRGSIDWFLGIHDKKSNNLLHYVKTYNYADRVPANLLPVAHDPGGNLLCLSVAGPDRGKVYFWDHEREVAEGEIPTYDNVYFVADSFDDLLNNLSEQPELVE